MIATSYQLWDLATGNCTGAYDEEATALADVRAGVREDGQASFFGVALLRTGNRADDIHPIAEGAELVALALTTILPLPRARTSDSEVVHDSARPDTSCPGGLRQATPVRRHAAMRKHSQPKPSRYP